MIGLFCKQALTESFWGEERGISVRACHTFPFLRSISSHARHTFEFETSSCWITSIFNKKCPKKARRSICGSDFKNKQDGREETTRWGCPTFTPPEKMSYISFSAVQPHSLWITWGKHWMKSYISFSPEICWLLAVAPPSSDHTWHVFVGASASQGIGQSCQCYGHLGLLRVLAEYSQFRP